MQYDDSDEQQEDEQAEEDQARRFHMKSPSVSQRVNFAAHRGWKNPPGTAL